MVVKAKKYVCKRHFDGVPKRNDFEIIEEQLPPLKNGEYLVKSEWISVDPYHRAYNALFPVPFDQFGFTMGTVVESKNSDYPTGTKVVHHKGWCTYKILNDKTSQNYFEDVKYKAPVLDLDDSHLVGVAGMPGVTAYFGFLDICQPKAGETVVVTAAAGAVGSIVGQIAKIKGCRVIGFAGSDGKCRWLETELGFDKALNYKTMDAATALKEAAPNGIDCYFDNVGGELSSTIISQMNDFGRVSVCGAISGYNNMSDLPKATMIQTFLMFKQLKIQGFVVSRYLPQLSKAVGDINEWVKSGKLKVKQHVTVGFDKVFDAFVSMLAGDNYGKAVVKV